MEKPQIGLIGCFQNGKSTLVNCLLENRVAITGEGVAKTKKIARYVYGQEAGFFSIATDGRRKSITKEQIYDIMLRDASRDGTVCEMVLPSPLLRKVDIVDTPGFDAGQTDTSVTTGYIQQLDFIFLVIGRGAGGGGLNQAEKGVLKEIVKYNKPFAVLFNCRDTLHWNPRAENVRKCIGELVSSFKNNDICPYSITSEDFILPVNLAWYWQAVVKQGLDSRFCFFDTTDAEKTLLREVKNYFYDDYEGLPTAEQLIDLSNIDWVKRYITAPQNAIASLIYAIPAPNLTCRLDGTTVHATWNSVNPTHSYELIYLAQGEPSWRMLPPTSDHKATFANLVQGQTYEFRIRAMANDNHSVSKYSEVVRMEVPRKKSTVVYVPPDPNKPQPTMLDDFEE